MPVRFSEAWRPLAVAMASAVLLTCSETGLEVGTSSFSIRVSNTTVGDDTPAGPYTASVQIVNCDGASLPPLNCSGIPGEPPLSASLPIDQSVTFNNLGPGYYRVLVGGVPGNCYDASAVFARIAGVSLGSSALGGPSGSSTETANFTFTCKANRIAVTTSTSGTPDGATEYSLSVDGDTPVPIGLEDTYTVRFLAAGQHEVELGGLPLNCTVSTANPLEVTVTESETAEARFDIECQEPVRADAGSDQNVNVGSQVTLDATASTPADAIQTYEWVRIHQTGQSAAPADGVGEVFSFTLNEPDSLEYVLTVSDGTSSDIDTVVVRSNPPTIESISPTSGAVGTLVTINGNNFSPTAGQNTVYFNGLSAAVTSDAITQLTASVPATATSGTVSVQVSGTGDVASGPVFTVSEAGTWTRVYSEFSDRLTGVSVVDQSTVTAVGNVILRTTNGGGSWTSQTTPATTLSLRDVHFTDASTGTAVGTGSLNAAGGGLILRTTDGGQSWDPANGVNDNARIGGHNAVFCTDANTGTVVGNAIGGTAATIFRTTDGGATWTQQTSPNIPLSTRINDVYFVNGDTGTVVGRDLITPDALILRTEDGGATWNRQAVPGGVVDATLNAVFFVDASTGWAVGSRGGANSAVILHTTDGGDTWVEQGQGQVGGTNTVLFDVFFSDAQTGTVVSEGPPNLMLYRTEDGGVSWTQEYEGSGNYVGGEAVGFANADVGYVVMSNGLIWRRQP